MKYHIPYSRIDLLADCHNILSRKNYFFQLLNVHNVSDVTQIEVHTAELVSVFRGVGRILLRYNNK
jgi:hypothetical protein